MRRIYASIAVAVASVATASGIAIFSNHDKNFTLPGMSEIASAKQNTPQNECVPDTKGQENDIFFLSCGGIY